MGAPPTAKNHRLRNFIIGYFAFLVFANLWPWLVLLMTLGLITWALVATRRDTRQPLSYVIYDRPRHLVGLSIILSILPIVVSCNAIAGRWQDERKAEADHREKALLAEQEHRARQERENQLRSSADQAATAFEAGIAAAESLLRDKQMREALEKLQSAKSSAAAYLALSPLPNAFAALVPRYEAAATSVAPLRDAFEKREQYENKRHQLDALVNEENWIAAEATASEAANLLAAISSTPAEVRRNLTGFSADLQRRDLERMRRRIKPKAERVRSEQAAEKLLHAVCGEKPVCGGGWDGECVGLESAVRRVAHDPDSIDVENCTDAVLSEKHCWVTTCDVRGKNMFGAKILQRKRFSKSALGWSDY